MSDLLCHCLMSTPALTSRPPAYASDHSRAMVEQLRPLTPRGRPATSSPIASEGATDRGAHAHHGGEAERDQVRLHAGAAGVAAGGCHRSVLAILRGCVIDSRGADQLHGHIVRLL